jgi:N-acetylglucosaminyldiphosphoundecaprenol N-acetyl-beta-D-mannosaminyltransferase
MPGAVSFSGPAPVPQTRQPCTWLRLSFDIKFVRECEIVRDQRKVAKAVGSRHCLILAAHRRMITIMSADLAVTELLGIRFLGQGKQALLPALAEKIDRREKTIVLSGNVHGFNLAYEQPWLRDFYNRADFIRIDGAGLRLGARLLGQKLPARVTLADFIWDLATYAEPRGYRLFFLGAAPGIARAAADRLQERYPALQIVGIQHGFFTKTAGHPENETVLNQIAASRPDVLFVGMGMPLQERWLCENWERLAATVILSAGALFDYTAGHLQRPPAIFTRTGFEWLGRLLIEPERLWRRYLVGNPLFIWRIVRQRFGRGPL